jgi:hypothetical protein
MAEPLQPAATETLNPAATAHLPKFMTAPGETDVLMVVTAIFLIVAVLSFGVFFFRLHTLPERMAHKTHKVQFEIVAVLGLIALFTHMHIFWIIGLLLALIEVPDFGGMLGRITGSVEKMAGVREGEGASETRSQPLNEMKEIDETPQVPPDRTTPVPRKLETVEKKKKELGHA